MAIYWDTTACAKGGPQNEEEAEQRKSLILVGSNLGLSSLDHDNPCEWFVRMRVWERHCNVKPDHWFGGRDLVTVLNRWVGIKLNVQDRSREQWVGDLYRGVIEEAEDEIVELTELRAAGDPGVIATEPSGAYVQLDDGDTVCVPWN